MLSFGETLTFARFGTVSRHYKRKFEFFDRRMTSPPLEVFSENSSVFGMRAFPNLTYLGFDRMKCVFYNFDNFPFMDISVENLILYRRWRVKDTGWTVMEAETQEIMCPQAQRYYTKVGQCSTFKKKSGYAAL